ncbi:hypothetical protein ACM6L3_08935 [Paenibacillus larvae]
MEPSFLHNYTDSTVSNVIILHQMYSEIQKKIPPVNPSNPCFFFIH